VVRKSRYASLAEIVDIVLSLRLADLSPKKILRNKLPG
jgi:hypothetical protein